MDRKKKDKLANIVLGSCMSLTIAGMLTGVAYFDPPGFNKMKNDVIRTIGSKNYAYNYFTKSLKKRKVYERSQAAENLGRIGKKEAVPRLKLVLENPYEDMQVKETAAVAIRKLTPNQYFKEKFGDLINKDRESLVITVTKILDSLNHEERRVKATGEYADLYEKTVRNYTKEFYKLNEEKRLDMINFSIISNLLEELRRKETLSKLGGLVNADLKNGDVELEGVRKDGTYGHYTTDASKTELGGLVKVIEKEGEKRLVFESYEPRALLSDGGYLGNDSYAIDDAVCSFHLHATDKKGDSGFAGPSFIFGDLSAASWSSRDGVVITYLGTDKHNNIRINVDYYTRDWVVVDLGNYDTGIKLDENIEETVTIDSYEEIEQGNYG